MKQPIRVLLVDDHRVVLAGLKRLLEDSEDIRVPLQAVSGEEALAALKGQEVEVALVDIRLPGKDGFEICREIKRMHPGMKVLMLTSVADDGMILEAIRSGADGYLLKEIDAEELTAGVRTVAAGGILFDPSATRGIIQRLDQGTKVKKGPEELTARERRLLQAVAEGKTNRQLAEEFALSEGTVRNYLTTIFEKLGVSRRSQAVAEFFKIQPPR